MYFFIIITQHRQKEQNDIHTLFIELTLYEYWITR